VELDADGVAVRLLALAAITLVLLPATPASAREESMRINEISVADGKVELLDVLPDVQPDDLEFSNPDGYAVRSYDGAGNEVAARQYPQPIPPPFRNTPFVLDLALPAGAGQVCFEKGRDPNDVSPLESFRIHCLGYGKVTRPVVRRMYIYGARIRMPVTPGPGPGQSVQRQACGRAALAAPTLGAKNATVRVTCADSSPVCDDPSSKLPRAKLTLKLPRKHDVDRPFVVKVKLSNNGTVSMRGSFYAPLGPLPPTDPRNPKPPPGSFVFGPIERDLRAGVTARVRIPISRKARALVKRAARRGKQTRGGLVTVARGTCESPRWHSTRQFRLVP
jgi:hypothetical protein